jgi:aryl-alcohol dehydrogenase-like predicted oxidoreductase
MEYRRLGRTDIDVSVICLGTMTWGEQNTQDEGFAQMDRAIEYGVNFFDVAEMYPVPTRAETYGETERIIGNWFASRGSRDKVVLATKVTGRSNGFKYMRDGNICLDRKNIEAAIEDSLKRLQTDYVDLYQLHWPDRNTNFFGQLGYQHEPADNEIPIEETLGVLNDLVKTGKVRHIGLSNETPWGTMQFVHVAEQKNYPRVVSVQNPYSLLNRTFEVGLAEVAHREDTGLLAYSPLGFGVLSGKYLHDRPAGARLTLFEQFTRYTNQQAIEATKRYVELAHNSGLDPAQMALAFVNSRSFVTSNIIGATNTKQLEDNLKSSELTLSNDVLREIEIIHTEHPNPSP